MPVMDGFEATRRLRIYEKEQQLQPLKVFALTAGVSEALRQECTLAGMKAVHHYTITSHVLHVTAQPHQCNAPCHNLQTNVMLGMDGFVSKPVTRNDLANLLASQIN